MNDTIATLACGSCGTDGNFLQLLMAGGLFALVVGAVISSVMRRRSSARLTRSAERAEPVDEAIMREIDEDLHG